MRRIPLVFLARADWARLVLGAGLVAGFGVLCLIPHVGWIRDPSLFDDDFTRIGGFRRYTFPAALFRPFNEHLAPLFELVGWLAWWHGGERVEVVAGDFLIASYAAWATTLGALAAVVRLEMRSSLAALVAVACLALSTIAGETVLWFSASSFSGPRRQAVLAWFAATKGLRAISPLQRRAWWGTSAAFAIASPLFSAIGALGGPLAAIRILIAGRSDGLAIRSVPARLGASLVPLVGTTAYACLVAANPYHGSAVAASVRSHLDILAVCWATLRAPGAVLVPMTLGLPSLAGWLPDAVAAALTLGLVASILAWGWRRPSRPLLVVGLGFIVGGYLLTYLTRTQAGDRWIFDVGRYHFFPQLGLICWIAALADSLLDRIARHRPLLGLLGVVVFAAIALIVQGPRMSELARRWFRYPEQHVAIAAAIRLEAICQREQIPLAQAIRIIDPIEPRWFPRPLPFHPLLYLFGPGPSREPWSDPDARSRVLGALSPLDREAIFGGLDSSRYRGVANTGAIFRLQPTTHGQATRIGEAPTFYNEFPLPAGLGDVATLDLEGVTPDTKVEIWWAGADYVWQPGRSVRWTNHVAPQPVQLSQLPHWRPRFANSIRVVHRGRPLPSQDHPTLALTFTND